MMCHRIGRPPMATIGLGIACVSSERRVPRPPARMTVFTKLLLSRRELAKEGTAASSFRRQQVTAYAGSFAHLCEVLHLVRALVRVRVRAVPEPLLPPRAAAADRP